MVGDNMEKADTTNKTNIVIDINNIVGIKQKMDSECNNLLGMIQKYRTMFDETKAIYDTESGTLYRKLADGYLSIVESYIKNSFLEQINRIDNIKASYDKEINAISQMIKE